MALIWGKKMIAATSVAIAYPLSRGINVRRIHPVRRNTMIKLELLDPGCNELEEIELTEHKARVLAETILKTLKTP